MTEDTAPDPAPPPQQQATQQQTTPPPPAAPAFQQTLEAYEGMSSSRLLPPPVNPLQAQTQFERRARTEDFVAHGIAVIIVLGFFVLAGMGLLGFVDLNHSTVAASFGSIIGYAVGKVDPVLTRYFTARAALLQHAAEVRPDQKPAPEQSNTGGKV